MARYGVEVTDNRDTHAATPEEKLYSSEYQSPKLHNVYKGTFTTSGTSFATVTIDHGLPYPPVVYAYYRHPSGEWEIPDNTKIGLEANMFTAVLKTKNDPSTDGAAFKLLANTTYDYKFWVFIDPTKEI